MQDARPQATYRRWRYAPRAVQNRLASMLIESAKLLSNSEVHWLQTYAILGTFLFLLALSLFLTQGNEIARSAIDGSLHQVLRYLYLIVIILAAYVLDQRVAVWLAIFCTGIYLPAWVNQYAMHAWEAPTFEILVLLLAYNVFAIFASTMTAFGRDHRRLSDMVLEFENAFAQAFDLQRLPLWILKTSIELTHASYGELYVVAVEDGQQQLTDAPKSPYADLPGLIKWALAQDRTLNLSHIQQDPRIQMPDDRESENGYVLMVPLTTPALDSGLLVLWRYSTPFRKREEELIQLLVARGHLILENARLHAKTDDALTQRANELAILLDASNSFATTLDLDQMVEILARKLVQVTRASGCQINLIDEDGFRLLPYAANWHTDMPVISPRHSNGKQADHVAYGADLPFHQRVLNEGSPVEVSLAHPRP
ncbi:MAG: hypothetical protein R2873_29925 [Caldilineaceae bacterium]